MVAAAHQGGSASLPATEGATEAKTREKVIDGTEVSERNVIQVVFEDLPDKEQKKIEHEFQQEVEELRRKMECYRQEKAIQPACRPQR